ncbi:hypothetical protein K7432_000367 [Basidiobolus ranarum]|uniref:gamma-glutamylcyclotransferase n=1 Tax=Basidiobolus ranarum TaxID=34480 RepID=A0ABR2X4S9_9FUNG
MAISNNTEDQLPNMVWYLAYGANMSKDVLTGRRQVKPIRSVPVRVPGYYLAFDLPGMPYIEPGFASIRSFPSDPEDSSETRFFPVTRNKRESAPVVHGVAHLITAEDFRQVQLTEGGGGSTEYGYQVKIVECESYTKEKINAHTLMSHDHCIRPSLPSLRYLTILRVGSKEHEVDPEFREYLDDLLHFEAHSWRQKIGKYIFFMILIPIFGPILLLRGLSKKGGEGMGSIFHWWWHLLGHFIWILHDQFFEPLLGNGGSSEFQAKLKSI